MSQRVIAAVSDLFFAVKVNDVLKKLGMELKLAKSIDDVLEKVKTPTDLIIIDLNDRAIPAMDLIRALKGASELSAVPLLAFASHVQAELMNEAKAAGAEAVVIRSVFAERLPELVSSLLLKAPSH